MHSKGYLLLLYVSIFAVIKLVNSFTFTALKNTNALFPASLNGIQSIKYTEKPVTGLNMAGFGSSSSSKKKKGSDNSSVKLKPKAQWDKYMSLKKSQSVQVSVRVVQSNSDQNGEWLQVGRVKSENDEYTEAAIVMQRGIIAEHARRLYPLKILPKDTIEWGYAASEEDETMKVVDKSAIEMVNDGIEKKIGFQGKADPATGYYCHYENGRLVDKSD
jgi:hypothetical protein